MRFDGLTRLEDIVRTLIEKRDALSDYTRLMGVSQHVGLDLEHHEKLELTFPDFTTSKFVSCFVDTKDYDLAGANMWLRYQDNIRTLESSNKLSSSDERALTSSTRSRIDMIEERVAQLLGVQRAHHEALPESLCCDPNTRRTYVTSSPSSSSCSLYIDCAEIACNDFYLVGTISLPARNETLRTSSSVWPPQIASGGSSATSPIRSPVAESLYINHKDVYDELVRAGKVTLPPDNWAQQQCSVKPKSFPVPDPLPSSSKEQDLLIAWNQRFHHSHRRCDLTDTHG